MCIDRRHHQRGVTLIELIMFIVIVSVALVGVLTVFNVTTRSSADPMIRKQMLAIAEAVLDEVQSQPFTWCDPDDPAATTATGAGGCTAAPNGAAEGIGAETVTGNTDARLSATSPFDNVSDYDGAAITTTITGTPMPAGFSAAVTVAQAALSTIAAADALLITVTVTRGGDSVVLEGYRARHSPNNLP